jgi:hypothetical protein
MKIPIPRPHRSPPDSCSEHFQSQNNFQSILASGYLCQNFIENGCSLWLCASWKINWFLDYCILQSFWTVQWKLSVRYTLKTRSDISFHSLNYEWLKRCPDKTSRDKMSVDKTSVGTKCPWGQNVCGDKTSVGTKHPSDKTSVGTKGLSDKTFGGQNVRGDKTSVGTKHPWTIRPSGSYLPGPLLGNFFYW